MEALDAAADRLKEGDGWDSDPERELPAPVVTAPPPEPEAVGFVEKQPDAELLREAHLTEWDLGTHTLQETLGAMPAFVDSLLEQRVAEIELQKKGGGGWGFGLSSAVDSLKSSQGIFVLAVRFFEDATFLEPEQHRVLLYRTARKSAILFTAGSSAWKTVSATWLWIAQLLVFACDNRFRVFTERGYHSEARCTHTVEYYLREAK
jgi:hypothetical protein